MLYSAVDGGKWKSTVVKKLCSFCDKCPVLLSIQTGLYNGVDGVYIVHQNTGTKYFFPWDCSKDPKEFIHEIKEFLVPRHYPLLVESIKEEHTLTPVELAEMVEKGADIHNLPTTVERVVSKKLWRIEKVLAWKDIFILQEVDPETKKEIGNQFRYKYNSLSITYLKSYRSGEFKNAEEAGDEFFKSAILVNEIIPKEA